MTGTGLIRPEAWEHTEAAATNATAIAASTWGNVLTYDSGTSNGAKVFSFAHAAISESLAAQQWGWRVQTDIGGTLTVVRKFLVAAGSHTDIQEVMIRTGPNGSDIKILIDVWNAGTSSIAIGDAMAWLKEAY